MKFFPFFRKFRRKQNNPLANCIDEFCGQNVRRASLKGVEFLPKLKCIVDELEDGRVLVTLSADYLRSTLLSISFVDDYLIVERRFVTTKRSPLKRLFGCSGYLRKSIKSYYIPGLDESSLSYGWQGNHVMVSLKKKSVEAVYDRTRIQKK